MGGRMSKSSHESGREPMVCSVCGVTMNCHATKIHMTNTEIETEAFEVAIGGFIEEFHTCPRCGKTLSRLEGQRKDVQG